MAGGKQHSGHRQYPLHALRLQALEAIAQNRPRELQIAVFHGHPGQLGPQSLRQLSELTHRLTVAAAMAADQHPDRATLHSAEGGVAIKLRRGVAHGRLCLM